MSERRESAQAQNARGRATTEWVETINPRRITPPGRTFHARFAALVREGYILHMVGSDGCSHPSPPAGAAAEKMRRRRKKRAAAAPRCEQPRERRAHTEATFSSVGSSPLVRLPDTAHPRIQPPPLYAWPPHVHTTLLPSFCARVERERERRKLKKTSRARLLHRALAAPLAPLYTRACGGGTQHRAHTMTPPMDKTMYLFPLCAPLI